MKRRIAVLSTLLGVGVLATGALLLLDRREREEALRTAAVPAVLQIEANGLRYTYHVLSGTEGLFDLRADPRSLRNLAPARPEHARRLRRMLEARLGVASLDELRAHRRDEIEDLEALGYL